MLKNISKFGVWRLGRKLPKMPKNPQILDLGFVILGGKNIPKMPKNFEFRILEEKKKAKILVLGFGEKKIQNAPNLGFWHYGDKKSPKSPKIWDLSPGLLSPGQ